MINNIKAIGARLSLLAALLIPGKSPAAYITGSGYFGLRGELRTAPGSQRGEETYAAINKSFSLKLEARIDDKASLYTEARIWGDSFETYLGEEASTDFCNDEDTGCSFSADNSYRPYSVDFSQVYTTIATDYCLVEAGRKARTWGMGMIYNSGESPFSRDQSLFEGVQCSVNMQKSQNLGFSVGYDKIAEGKPLDFNDDIEQYYVTLEFDDRDNSNSAFSKHIALYLSNVGSPSGGEVGLVDYKIFDLYAQIIFGNISIATEAVFKTGKAEEKYWLTLGGNGSGEQSIDGIAFATRGEWTLSGSSSSVDMKETQPRPMKSHKLVFEFISAPGDTDGYSKGNNPILGNNRDNLVEAIALNKNFKPALLMFNGRSEQDKLDIDGIYSNDKLVNVRVFSLGYQYQDLSLGNFQTKIINASLIEGIPSEIEEFFTSNQVPDENYYKLYGDVPVGYYGTNVGTEINIGYSKRVANVFTLGVDVAYLLPGVALKVTSEEPEASIGILSSLSMVF